MTPSSFIHRTVFIYGTMYYESECVFFVYFQSLYDNFVLLHVLYVTLKSFLQPLFFFVSCIFEFTAAACSLLYRSLDFPTHLVAVYMCSGIFNKNLLLPHDKVKALEYMYIYRHSSFQFTCVRVRMQNHLCMLYPVEVHSSVSYSCSVLVCFIGYHDLFYPHFSV